MEDRQQEGELAALLQELSQQGRFNSSGQFQVDLTRSLHRLTQFTDKSPYYFLRHLVSAAVGLRATKLTIEIRFRRWRFHFDGQPLGQEELGRIFSSLAGVGADRLGLALRELGLALCNCHGVAGCHILIQTDEAVLELAPNSLSLSPAHGPKSGEVLVEVRFPSLLKRLLTRELPGPYLKGLGWPEALQGARFSGMSVSLEGRELPFLPFPAHGGKPSSLVASLAFQGRAHLPHIDFHAPVTQGLQEEESELSALMALAAPGPPSRPGTMLVLSLGWLFVVQAPWALDDSWILAAHDGLKRDLLGRQLVVDETFTQVTERLQQLQFHLLRQALESPELNPDQVNRLFHQVQRLWFKHGKLVSPWDKLAIVRPGGWSRALLHADLKALYQEQGYLHHDPSEADAFTRKVLRSIAPTLIEQRPYQAVQAATGNWLLTVPTPWGEIRYSADWPGQAATINVAGLPFFDPVQDELPPGLHISLRQELATSKQLWYEQLILLKAVLVNLLESNPRRFLGSAPALRLVLWLCGDLPRLFSDLFPRPTRKSASRLPYKMHLRLYPHGSCRLADLLSRHRQSYLLEGLEQTFKGDPVLWLSETELALLQRAKAGWLRPFSHGLSDLLAKLTTRAQAWEELLHYAAEALGGEAALLLDCSESPRIVGQVGKTGEEHLKRYRDVAEDQSLRYFIWAAARRGEALFSHCAVKSQGAFEKGSWTSYVTAPLEIEPGRVGAIYVGRKARRGDFDGGDLSRLVMWVDIATRAANSMR